MRYLSNVATLVFSPGKCTGCGTCIEVCPHAVFEPSGKKVRVIDSDLCMECGACAKNCEFGALEVHAGVGCASALIRSMLTGGEPVCGCTGPESDGCC